MTSTSMSHTRERSRSRLGARKSWAVREEIGHETELYEYDSRAEPRWHSLYTRNGARVVKMETTNFSKHKSVTETDTYDRNGVLTAKTANEASVKTEKASVSITRSADGSISIIERFADGSSRERTVNPNGTTVVHFHSRQVDWREVTDANNRSFEYDVAA
jgi:hypothetical protein